MPYLTTAFLHVSIRVDEFREARFTRSNVWSGVQVNLAGVTGLLCVVLTACGATSNAPEGPTSTESSGQGGTGAVDASSTGSGTSVTTGSTATTGGVAIGGNTAGDSTTTGDAGTTSCAVVNRAPLENVVHREVATSCSPDRPVGPVCPNPTFQVVCERHEDCDDGNNGRCSVWGTSCSYDDCFADSDCAPDELCLCNGGLQENHVCIQANCHTDSDCEAGRWCSPSAGACPNFYAESNKGAAGFFCHGATDDCQTDEDCVDGWCVFDRDDQRWECTQTECTD